MDHERIVQFHQAMLDLYDRIRATIPKYNPTDLLQKIQAEGGHQAAKTLLVRRDPPPSGLTRLFVEGHPELSLEELVLSQNWQSLFTIEELTEAKRRLGRK